MTWNGESNGTHSSALAWKIPWMEEPGRLQSMGLLRVGQDWAASLSLFTFLHWRRKWQPTPVFLPGESQGPGGLVGCRLCGVTQSWTQLKRLSSSSSSRTWKIFPRFLNLWKFLVPFQSAKEGQREEGRKEREGSSSREILNADKTDQSKRFFEFLIHCILLTSFLQPREMGCGMRLLLRKWKYLPRTRWVCLLACLFYSHISTKSLLFSPC